MGASTQNSSFTAFIEASSFTALNESSASSVTSSFMASNASYSTSTLSARAPKNSRMTNDKRRRIGQILLLNYSNNKLKHGTLKRLRDEYNISKTTMTKYWKIVHEQIKAGMLVNVDRSYKGSKKRVIIDLEKVRHIALHKRTSVRSLAFAMNLHPSTVHRLVQKGKIRSHSNALKPTLTNKNMIDRMQWVLDNISMSSLRAGILTFEDMYNVVHMDEKWFYLTRTSQKYYLLPDEPEPHRTCKSKRFITKIMFMGAVARPRISSDGTVNFDGKIGVFPFSVIVPAKRTSKNRSKGTLELRPIERITKTVIKQCILEKVLPAIKLKFQDRKGQKIFIQQDNARPHISPRDPDFVRAATQDGWNIELICQPPNSPDLNVLDLGYFRAIQTIQHEKAPKNVCQLVTAVVKSYEEIKPETLNFTWLSLQYCMNEVLRVKGNNCYKLPHVGKLRLQRLNLLPQCVEPKPMYVAEAMVLVSRHARGVNAQGQGLGLNAHGSDRGENAQRQNEGEQDAANQDVEEQDAEGHNA